jgi:hypothetical protein
MMTATDFSITGSSFSFLRSPLDESIPLIRILNSHLCDWDQSMDQFFESWQDVASFAANRFLLVLFDFGNDSAYRQSVPN